MGLQDERPRAAADCWMCGSAGNSGEHIAKKSDLKAVFDKVSPQQPLYLNNAAVRNKRVNGFNADALKWADILCEHCNTTRTQPHDRAWERLSAALRARLPTLKAGDGLGAADIFPEDPTGGMLAVHLYFVKAFGCLIVQGNAPIDIRPFAAAIMENRALPEFYIQFGPAPPDNKPSVVMASPLRLFYPPAGGPLVQATWFYDVDGLWTEARLVPGETGGGVAIRQGAWHPSLGTTGLKMAAFTP